MSRLLLIPLQAVFLASILGCLQDADEASKKTSGQNNLAYAAQTYTGTRNFYKMSKIYDHFDGFDHMAWKGPSVNGYTNQGLKWLVADGSETRLGANLRYELWRDGLSHGDFMTSAYKNEYQWYLPSWQTDLGRFFTGSSLYLNGSYVNPSPLKPISRFVRTVNSTLMDHKLDFPGTYTDYKYEGDWGYGIPRLGKDRDITPAGTQEDVWIKKNNVSIGFLRHWGGILNRINFGNVEYVNRAGCGRQIQMVASEEGGERYNPTEGGDFNWNGAPLISDLAEPASSPTKYTTTTLPLMFKNPDGDESAWYQNGLSPDNVLLYGGLMKKTVEILPDTFINNVAVKKIRLNCEFKSYEDKLWKYIGLAFHFNFDGLMNTGSLAGRHTLWSIPSGQTSWARQNRVDGQPNIRITRPVSEPWPDKNSWTYWSENVWPLQNGLAKTLLVASGETTNRAIAVLSGSPAVVLNSSGAPLNTIYAKNLVMNYTWVTGTCDPGFSCNGDMYSQNFHGGELVFVNVDLKKNQTLKYQMYILIGTENNILNASRTL